jgi:hypothetical protein
VAVACELIIHAASVAAGRIDWGLGVLVVCPVAVAALIDTGAFYQRKTFFGGNSCGFGQWRSTFGYVDLRYSLKLSILTG